MPTICPAGICRMPTMCPQGTVPYAIYMSCMVGLPFSTASVPLRSGWDRPASLSDIFEKVTICRLYVLKASSACHRYAIRHLNDLKGDELLSVNGAQGRCEIRKAETYPSRKPEYADDVTCGHLRHGLAMDHRRMPAPVIDLGNLHFVTRKTEYLAIQAYI